LSERRESNRPILHEGFFLAILAVFFISLVSWFVATTPNLGSETSAFVLGFRLVQVPNTSILLPAPVTPASYSTIYVAAAQFCLIWGIFEVFILILRFSVRSYSWRKVETFTRIIWWFGAYYLVTLFLNSATTIMLWFAFWGALFALIGGELIIRGIILAALTRLK
jgi:hypothetical protein